MTMPRFYFDNEPPQSVADKLLAEASELEIKLLRRSTGDVTAIVEMRSVLGADLFADDEDEGGDLMEQSRKSDDALALCRQLLCGFAAAAKGGDDR